MNDGVYYVDRCTATQDGTYLVIYSFNREQFSATSRQALGEGTRIRVVWGEAIPVAP